jgi:dihydroorotate dehydrogenase electron transfer subunit
MAKVKITAEVVKQTKIAEDIFNLIIKAPEIAEQAVAGQFVSLYTRDAGKLLPRPISLCGIDRQNGTLRLVYRVVGGGTAEFSRLTAGDTIDVLGPLGNGFRLEAEAPILMGGGIGIPPMLELAKEFSEKGLGRKDISVVLGYRDEAFLAEDFRKYATVYLSSDSGIIGTKGNVIDCAREREVSGDMIFACGPTPMLRAIKQYAGEKNLPAQLSLEEKMACGVGACLACVCHSTQVDDHSKVNNKRVCKDGPVFFAEEVEL